MQRFIKRFKRDNENALAILNNPDAGRSHYKPAFGSRSAAVVRLNSALGDRRDAG